MEHEPPRISDDDEGDEGGVAAGKFNPSELRGQLDALVAEGEDSGALRELSKKWAAHCLENFTGDLLKRGLAVSESIANFAEELDASA